MPRPRSLLWSHPLIEPSGILNAELADKGEYTSAANDLIMDLSTRPRPRDVLIAGNQMIVEKQFRSLRLKRPRKKWSREMAESCLIAYIYVISETWAELDRSHATNLVNQGLDGVQAFRKSVSFESIDLANKNERAYYAITGLGGTQAADVSGFSLAEISPVVAAWTPLYTYLTEQPSYQRIESMNEVHELLAPMMVKEKHVEEYQKGHRVSWSIGIASGFLDILGEVPMDENDLAYEAP